MAVPKVLIPMADLGHDPTGTLCYPPPLDTRSNSNVETSVPYTAFKDAGFEVQFATENGKSLQCDPKLLTGLTQKILVSRSHIFVPSFQGRQRETNKKGGKLLNSHL